jgi:hypothetical protein
MKVMKDTGKDVAARIDSRKYIIRSIPAAHEIPMPFLFPINISGNHKRIEMETIGQVRQYIEDYFGDWNVESIKQNKLRNSTDLTFAYPAHDTKEGRSYCYVRISPRIDLSGIK